VVFPFPAGAQATRELTTRPLPQAIQRPPRLATTARAGRGASFQRSAVSATRPSRRPRHRSAHALFNVATARIIREVAPRFIRDERGLSY